MRTHRAVHLVQEQGHTFIHTDLTSVVIRIQRRCTIPEPTSGWLGWDAPRNGHSLFHDLPYDPSAWCGTGRRGQTLLLPMGVGWVWGAAKEGKRVEHIAPSRAAVTEQSSQHSRVTWRDAWSFKFFIRTYYTYKDGRKATTVASVHVYYSDHTSKNLTFLEYCLSPSPTACSSSVRRAVTSHRMTADINTCLRNPTVMRQLRLLHVPTPTHVTGGRFWGGGVRFM